MKTLTATALAVVLTGCAGTTTKIYVNSKKQTNDGNVMYVMIRKAEGTTIGAENYQEVAAKLFTEPPDPMIIASQPIFPGSTASFTVEEAEEKDVVLYFFFTNPGTNWRVPLRSPLPAEVSVELGQHEIARVQVRRR
jgi:hypothetical protein